MLAAPFALDNPNSQRNRRLGVLAVLGWLRAQPGDSWQQRWRASGAEDQPDWRLLLGTDRANPLPHLTPGLLVLFCAGPNGCRYSQLRLRVSIVNTRTIPATAPSVSRGN